MISLSFAGCSKKGTVTFCEGVDQKEKGTGCGTVFTTGDLTALFTTRSALGVDTVTVKIFNLDDSSRKPQMTRSATVKPDQKNGRVELELYDEGRFRVVIERRGEVVAEGDIEIIDSVVKPQ
jgi:hypothetical protein